MALRNKSKVSASRKTKAQPKVGAVAKPAAKPKIRPKPSLTVRPRTISHYTDVSGLKGIVESKCLWASNASYLNDKAELVHAIEAAQKAIQKLSSVKAVNTWESLLNRVFSELSGGAIPETYVACFCRDDNNLSQWRGYSGPQQGVSITFDRIKLALRLRQDKPKFYQVVYAKFTTATKLRDALERELADIAELDELLGEDSEEGRYADLFSRVSALLPKFKHVGFKDEREWRFVIQKKCDPGQLKFRSDGNKIIPYIEVGCDNDRLPIKSIMVGPGHDQVLTAQSIKTFLIAHGYDVPVTLSDVPYRP